MAALKRRDIVRIITFSAGLVVILIGLLLASRQLAFENRRVLHTSYLRQTQELASGIEHIGEQLEIMGIASEKELHTDSAFEIWQLCSRSTENLTDLPISDYNTEALLSYLNRVGEYARFLAKKQTLDETDRLTLSELSSYSAELADKVYSLSDKLLNGKSGYADARVPQIEKTSFLGFSPHLDDAAKELSEITDGSPCPAFEYEGRYGSMAAASLPDTAAPLGSLFEEKILKTLPKNLHVIKWQPSTLDGAACVCVEVETPSQNIYSIYYSPSGRQLKIVRQN